MALGDLVASGTNNSGGGGSSTASVVISPAATFGNVLLVAVVTDDGADATAPAGYLSAAHADNTVVGAELFFKIANGETAFSASLSASQEWVCMYQELKLGTWGGLELDVNKTLYESSVKATGATGTTADTADAEELCCAVFGAQDGDAGPTDADVDNDHIFTVDGRAGFQIGDVYAVLTRKVLAAIGAQTCEATWNGIANSRSHNLIATFKESGVPTSVPAEYQIRRGPMSGNAHR